MAFHDFQKLYIQRKIDLRRQKNLFREKIIVHTYESYIITLSLYEKFVWTIFQFPMWKTLDIFCVYDTYENTEEAI